MTQTRQWLVLLVAGLLASASVQAADTSFIKRKKREDAEKAALSKMSATELARQVRAKQDQVAALKKKQADAEKTLQALKQKEEAYTRKDSLSRWKEIFRKRNLANIDRWAKALEVTTAELASAERTLAFVQEALKQAQAREAEEKKKEAAKKAREEAERKRFEERQKLRKEARKLREEADKKALAKPSFPISDRTKKEMSELAVAQKKTASLFDQFASLEDKHHSLTVRARKDQARFEQGDLRHQERVLANKRELGKLLIDMKRVRAALHVAQQEKKGQERELQQSKKLDEEVAIKRKEEARKRAEEARRKRAEEAAKRAREEAERKAREEAERKVREEAERKALEKLSAEELTKRFIVESHKAAREKHQFAIVKRKSAFEEQQAQVAGKISAKEAAQARAAHQNATREVAEAREAAAKAREAIAKAREAVANYSKATVNAREAIANYRKQWAELVANLAKKGGALTAEDEARREKVKQEAVQAKKEAVKAQQEAVQAKQKVAQEQREAVLAQRRAQREQAQAKQAQRHAQGERAEAAAAKARYDKEQAEANQAKAAMRKEEKDSAAAERKVVLVREALKVVDAREAALRKTQEESRKRKHYAQLKAQAEVRKSREPADKATLVKLSATERAQHLAKATQEEQVTKATLAKAEHALAAMKKREEILAKEVQAGKILTPEDWTSRKRTWAMSAFTTARNYMIEQKLAASQARVRLIRAANRQVEANEAAAHREAEKAALAKRGTEELWNMFSAETKQVEAHKKNLSSLKSELGRQKGGKKAPSVRKMRAKIREVSKLLAAAERKVALIHEAYQLADAQESARQKRREQAIMRQYAPRRGRQEAVEKRALAKLSVEELSKKLAEATKLLERDKKSLAVFANQLAALKAKETDRAKKVQTGAMPTPQDRSIRKTLWADIDQITTNEAKTAQKLADAKRSEVLIRKAHKRALAREAAAKKKPEEEARKQREAVAQKASEEGRELTQRLHVAGWSQAAARPGDRVLLSAKLLGYAPGTKVTFKIFPTNGDAGAPLAALSAESNENGDATAAWIVKFDVRAGHDPKLVFEATTPESRAISPTLTVVDSVNLVMQEEGGAPIAGMDLGVVDSSGNTHLTKIPADGKVRKDIPIGEFSLLLKNHLITSPGKETAAGSLELITGKEHTITWKKMAWEIEFTSPRDREEYPSGTKIDIVTLLRRNGELQEGESPVFTASGAGKIDNSQGKPVLVLGEVEGEVTLKAEYMGNSALILLRVVMQEVEEEPLPEDLKLPAGRDSDGDLLSDQLESQILNTYAPLFVFHPEENCWPSNVDHHLKHSLGVRVRSRDPQHPHHFDPARVCTRKTWAEVANWVATQSGWTDDAAGELYLALPLDRRVPASAFDANPASDFLAVSRDLEACRARVMLPQRRPLWLCLELWIEGVCYPANVPLHAFSMGECFDAAGSRYSAVKPVDILACPFGGTRKPADRISGRVKTSRFLARFTVSGIHAALGGADLPRGLDIDPAQLKIEVHTPRFQVRRNRRKQTVEPMTMTAQVLSLSKSVVFKRSRSCAVARLVAAPGKGEVSALDAAGVKALWKDRVPMPAGGPMVYGHVYLLRQYVVAQYWLFFGCRLAGGTRREGQWVGVDVVLYRNYTGRGRDGVVPTFNRKGRFSQKHIVAVTFRGEHSERLYYRNRLKRFKRFEPEMNPQNGQGMEAPLTWSRSTRGFNRGSGGTATHPVAWVARDTHEIYGTRGFDGKHYTRPGNLLSMLPVSRNARWSMSPHLLPAEAVDRVHAGDVNATVIGLPQLESGFFRGSIRRRVSGGAAVLRAADPFRLVNMGEVSYAHRRRLMCKEPVISARLHDYWNQSLPVNDRRPSEEKLAAMSTSIQSLEQELDVLVVGANPEDREKALQIQELQNRLVSLEAAFLVKRLRMLEPVVETRPTSGCEFLNFPGRFGRIVTPTEVGARACIGGAWAPHSDLLGSGQWNGGCGPGGGSSGHMTLEFYEDYEKRLAGYDVFGIEVEL